MKWGSLTLAALLLVGMLVYAKFAFSKAKPGSIVVIDGRAQYQVEVAESAVAKARGLSYRESLASDTGMLFVFSQAETRYFWMNAMHFPLDVVWIRDGLIVGLQENIPHPEANNGETARFESPEPADMVLEVNAGEISKQGIKTGQRIEVKKP